MVSRKWPVCLTRRPKQTWEPKPRRLNNAYTKGEDERRNRTKNRTKRSNPLYPTLTFRKWQTNYALSSVRPVYIIPKSLYIANNRIFSESSTVQIFPRVWMHHSSHALDDHFQRLLYEGEYVHWQILHEDLVSHDACSQKLFRSTVDVLLIMLCKALFVHNLYSIQVKIDHTFQPLWVLTSVGLVSNLATVSYHSPLVTMLVSDRSPYSWYEI